MALPSLSTRDICQDVFLQRVKDGRVRPASRRPRRPSVLVAGVALLVGAVFGCGSSGWTPEFRAELIRAIASAEPDLSISRSDRLDLATCVVDKLEGPYSKAYSEAEFMRLTWGSSKLERDLIKATAACIDS